MNPLFVHHRSRVTHRSARRRGQSLIFVALGIFVLLGFAALGVDYGMLTADASRLQRGADAAALAGASVLLQSGTAPAAVAYDQNNARNLAITVASRNGVTVTASDITFPAYNTIKVTPVYVRNYLFAPALGWSRGTVTRSCTAGRVALKGIGGAIPLAMTTNDYNTYKDGSSVEYNLIRNHDTDFAAGTVVALDLRPDNNGKSGAEFQNDLADGYDGTVYLGQQINNDLNADIASQGQKMERGLDARFDDAQNASYNDTGSNYTFPNYPVGDRRIAMMIVADPNPADNSNPMITARFFVPVYLESYRSPDKKEEYIRFRILPSFSFSSQDPNIVLGDSSTPYTGASVITMMQ